ncbi:MAG TPA: DUF2306 domain-containing protein [Actinomycetota bacterium]|nr:DUF2306 domain-containing protein [Actinomycetota bacterium]
MTTMSLRRRRPGGTRAAGRTLVVAGALVAGSALWMRLMYPQEGTGDVLYLFRPAFSTVMVASIVLGFAAIRRREIARHRAWMIRADAIALAAGTQAFTMGVGGARFGDGVLAHDLSIASAWLINQAVAEWEVRRRPAPRRRPPAMVGAQP